VAWLPRPTVFTTISFGLPSDSKDTIMRTFFDSGRPVIICIVGPTVAGIDCYFALSIVNVHGRP